jgi:protein-tyrosine kinase
VYKRQENTRKAIQNLRLKENFLSSEQIRVIRTNLDYMEENEPFCLLVTSPNYQEQKYFISAKLAMSIAEQGKKVLLVDANMRHPSLHTLFQLNNTIGLTNLLSKEAYSQVPAQETFVEGLSVLTTGLVPMNASPLWVSSKIKEVINLLETQYDVVVFEGPEFMSVSDSQVLAAYCDGIVLVIRANKTKKVDVLHTKNTLERANKKILGVIYHTG